MAVKRDLQFEAFYPYPPERVWKAISDASELSSWLMTTDFKPVVGQHYTMKANPSPGFDGMVTGEVLEVVPLSKLVYSWNGGPVKNTTVHWTLQAKGTGTMVRLEHKNFQGPAALAVSVVLGMGWKGLIQKKLLKYLKEVMSNE
jgi:uncharacterized protein YndB with AHSA1/START domain